MSRNLIVLFSFLALPLFLTACLHDWGPHPWGSGYAHHSKLHKSPPGPDADDLGYEFSVLKNEKIQEEWRVIANDFVESYIAETGIPSTPIYIAPVRDRSAFNLTFDAFLREAFQDQNFPIAHNWDEISEEEFYFLVSSSIEKTQEELEWLQRRAYGQINTDDPLLETRRPLTADDNVRLHLKLMQGPQEWIHFSKAYDPPQYGFNQIVFPAEWNPNIPGGER